MQPILSRLNTALFEAENEHYIIDLTNEVEAKNALDKTRGPCVGWADYKAGRDYQPPYIWDTSDSGGSHTGRTGQKDLKSPAVPIGPKDNAGNKYSQKYHGVRPWSPDEVLAVLANNSENPSARGRLWSIAHKQSVQRAYSISGRGFDPEDAVALGLHAAWRAIDRDRGMPGVRFTSFAGHEIENGMIAGVPAGYGDEYRKARGLISRLDVQIRKASRAISSGKSANDAAAEIRNLLSVIDPNPSPSNEYGMLPPRLLDIGNTLLSAIESGDPQTVQMAIQQLGHSKEQIEDEEDSYRVRGPSTDTTITKSKEQKAIQMKPMTIQSKETGKDIERSDIVGPTGAAVSAPGQGSAGSDYVPASEKLHSDPKIREALSFIIKKMRSGSGSGTGWSAELALKALDKLESVIMSDSPKNKNFRIEPSNDGFNVVNDTGVVGHVDFENEAESLIRDLQKDPRLMTVNSVLDNITSEYGEYAVELQELCREMNTMLKSGDLSLRQEILADMESLRSVAREDTSRGSKSVNIEPLTQQQYRILLRLFGISDYPERGTKDDPEIDPEVGMSKWARQGYPPITDNTVIAKDLGVSGARVSQLRSKIDQVLPAVIEKLQDELYESGEISAVDYNILTEVRVLFGKILLESLIKRKNFIH